MQSEWQNIALDNIFDITDIIDGAVVGIFRVCFSVKVSEFYDRPEDVINMLRRVSPLCVEALAEKVKAVREVQGEASWILREQEISKQFEGLISKMLNDKKDTVK